MAVQMRPTIIIYNPATAMQVADMTSRARDPELTDAACAFTVQMGIVEAAQYLDRDQALLVYVTWYGRRAVYRMVTPTLGLTGVRFQAYNLVVALEDLGGYTELWSYSGVASWIPFNPDYNSRYGDNWMIDTNNRLFMAFENNATYPHSAGLAGLGYATPTAGTRTIAALQVDVTFVAIPANFRWQASSANRDFSSIATLASLVSPGTSTYAYCLSLGTPRDLLMFELFNVSGAPVLYTGETGAAYARMTNVRVATSVTNLIATTVALAIATGSQVVTPASMARIAVGQRLVINSGAADSESVVVTAITATTFTATFAKAHLAGATVRAIVVYDQEIARDMLSQAVALNASSGLQSSTSLIQSSGQDLLNKAWAGAAPLDVLKELAAPVQYRFGVNPQGQLYYWPSGTNARRWSVRAAEVELARTLDTVANSVRASYQDAAGVEQVTAYSTDASSVAATGLTRRRTVAAQTTSATLATTIRDAALSDTKTRTTQSSIRFRRLFDEAGVEYPADQLEVGDSVTITNLPPVLSAALRTFTAAEVSIDPMTGLPSVVPESPLPQHLDVLLAQLATA